MFTAKCLPIDDSNNQWSYCPSVAAALLFAILFLATTIVHVFQAIRYRRAFCLVIIVGALWETAAFAFRILSARNPTHKGSYDVSFLLILLAPVCINAFDYMVISRLVRKFLGRLKLLGLSGQVMGKLFVCCDIVSFCVQIGGGLLSLSKTAKTAKTGLHVVTGGVIFQEALIVFFLAVTIAASQKLALHVAKHPGKIQIRAVQASLALITYRIVYRIVEFSSGQGSSINVYIDHHEWPVYVFDASPMLFALVIMNIWHPGNVLEHYEASWDG